MKKWKSTKRWNMGAAQNTPLLDVMKMTLEERIDLAEFYRKQYVKRVKDVTKKGEIPYGVYRMEKDLKELLPSWGVDINKPFYKIKSGKHEISPELEAKPYIHNSLTGFISNFQDFFTWKSNTIEGWHRIIRTEEERWFGYHYEKDPETGKRHKVLNYHFKEGERTKFWNLFHELEAREGNKIINSDSIMETGYATLWKDLTESDGFDVDDYADEEGMTKLINIMEASLANKKLVFPEHEVEEEETEAGGKDPTSVGDADDERDLLRNNDAFAD